MDIDWNLVVERVQGFTLGDWLYAGIIITLAVGFIGYGFGGIFARRIVTRFGNKYEGGKAILLGILYCIIATVVILVFAFRFSKDRLPQIHGCLESAFSSNHVTNNESQK